MNGGIIGKKNYSKSGIWTSNDMLFHTNHIGGKMLDLTTNDGAKVTFGTYNPSSSALSIEAWVYWLGDDSRSTHVIASKRDSWSSSNMMWLFAVDNTGKIKIIQQSDSYGITTSSTSMLSMTNQWVHLAVTVASGGAGVIYINGVSQSLSYSNLSFGSDTSSAFAIGCDEATTEAFNGYMSDVRFWNTERTATQINANMFKRLAGNESGLVCYMPFSTHINDVTGNAGNGTLVNSAQLIVCDSNIPIAA